MNTPQDTRNIFQRLHAAMDEVAYIQKTAKIEIARGKSYMAVTHDQVTSRVRGALMKHGVIAFPVSVSRDTQPVTMVKEWEGKTSSSISFFTKCDVVYRFQNIDDKADYLDVPSIGDGIDPQDKSAGKAYSLAVKNAILKALMLETGENEEERPDGQYVPMITLEQVNELSELVAQAGAELPKVCGAYRVASLSALTEEQYEKVKRQLIRKKEMMNTGASDVDAQP